MRRRGTDASESIIGTPWADWIEALGGDDLIDARSGSDKVHAGAGNDTVRGGFGADTVQGGFGDDWLYGEAGHDFINGDFGLDHIDGGAGNDWLYDLSPEANRLDGGAGNDTVEGGAASILIGGDGDDLLRGGVLMGGGAGADTYVFAAHTVDGLIALDHGAMLTAFDPLDRIVIEVALSGEVGEPIADPWAQISFLNNPSYLHMNFAGGGSIGFDNPGALNPDPDLYIDFLWV